MLCHPSKEWKSFALPTGAPIEASPSPAIPSPIPPLTSFNGAGFSLEFESPPEEEEPFTVFVDGRIQSLSQRVEPIPEMRHLLKHKRTYCPDALTATERSILARPGVPSRLWRLSGKPLYLFVTRKLLGWADREGTAERGRVN